MFNDTFFTSVPDGEPVTLSNGFKSSSNWKATANEYIMITGTIDAEFAKSKLAKEEKWATPFVNDAGRAMAVFGAIHYDNAPCGQYTELVFGFLCTGSGANGNVVSGGFNAFVPGTLLGEDEAASLFFISKLYLDNDDAILFGREIFGMNKHPKVAKMETRFGDDVSFVVTDPDSKKVVFRLEYSDRHTTQATYLPSIMYAYGWSKLGQLAKVASGTLHFWCAANRGIAANFDKNRTPTQEDFCQGTFENQYFDPATDKLVLDGEFAGMDFRPELIQRSKAAKIIVCAPK